MHGSEAVNITLNKKIYFKNWKLQAVLIFFSVPHFSLHAMNLKFWALKMFAATRIIHTDARGVLSVDVAQDNDCSSIAVEINRGRELRDKRLLTYSRTYKAMQRCFHGSLLQSEGPATARLPCFTAEIREEGSTRRFCFCETKTSSAKIIIITIEITVMTELISKWLSLIINRRFL